LDPIVGVSVSVNGSTGNAIRVAPSLQVLGRDTIEEPVGPIVLNMAASSFSQLNSETTAKMYEEAAKSVAKAKVVWDLYFGLGGLGLTVVQQEKTTDLYGADLAGSSIDLARVAAGRAGVKAHFEAFDLRERFSLKWPDPEVIVVNPPRRGLDEAVLALLKESPVKQIIYMSCNPNSFARDARTLVDSNFNLLKVDAYDMLPQTMQVELLGVFAKRDVEI
jgi:tRNA/tmRNA/rRNA uracil-C5-methylase (TrmA/RlmC/RlmD family)